MTDQAKLAEAGDAAISYVLRTSRFILLNQSLVNSTEEGERFVKIIVRELSKLAASCEMADGERLFPLAPLEELRNTVLQGDSEP